MSNFKRKLSPSQINTFLSCKAKWFYQYILRLEGVETHHMLRGSMVHEVLEDFFKCYPKNANIGNLKPMLLDKMKEIFIGKWEKYEQRLEEICTRDNIDIMEIWVETEEMVEMFATRTFEQMIPHFRKTGNVFRAWRAVKPIFRELYVDSETLGVQGYIDSILIKEDKIFLVDYKTSSIYILPFEEEYERQLLIYALLYREAHGKLPDYVSINYLKYGYFTSMKVNEIQAKETEDIITKVHLETESIEQSDYPANVEYKFCAWCSFLDQCKLDYADLWKASGRKVYKKDG